MPKKLIKTKKYKRFYQKFVVSQYGNEIIMEAGHPFIQKLYTLLKGKSPFKYKK
jgi:hypothetical protein